MKTLIGAIQSFITHFLAVGMITSRLLLVAGEIRLAALKKASHGSSKLYPLHWEHDGYKSKGHLKIVLEILGKWTSIPFFLPFSK